MKTFSALSASQIVLFILGTAAPAVINMLLPAGPLHDALIALLAPLTALLLVIFRKPSDQGGSVSTAK